MDFSGDHSDNQKLIRITIYPSHCKNIIKNNKDDDLHSIN